MQLLAQIEELGVGGRGEQCFPGGFVLRQEGSDGRGKFCILSAGQRRELDQPRRSHGLGSIG